MNADVTTFKKSDKKLDKEIQRWTPEQEVLLAEWSEKATCYRWLHSRSEKRYRCRNYTFTIPVIILSTLTGTANFAMDSFVPESHKKLAMACVGSVNIVAGILSTLQNFLRYAELMESHRLSEVQWSKFGRNISVELALNPSRRKPANDFLKVCRAEYDRLIEQSPTIDDPIVNNFKSVFKDIDIHKPDMCNGLDKCKIFIPSEEEKKINIIADVGSKLIERSHHKKRNKVKSISSPKRMDVVDNANSPQSVAPVEQELAGLINMGRVSAFKKPLKKASEAEEKYIHPMGKIHEMVKQHHQVSELKIKEAESALQDIEQGDFKEDTESLTGSEQKFIAGIEDVQDNKEIDNIKDSTGIGEETNVHVEIKVDDVADAAVGDSKADD